MKLYLTMAGLLLITAQQTLAQILPRGLSESEKQMMAKEFLRPRVEIPGDLLISRAPADMPRAMAEWEEMQAIVITWAGYQSILKEIVRYATEEVTVMIVTPNEASVRNYLESNGIDLSENVEFIDADYNSVWIRDYGANPVYIRDVDSLVLVDWIYNRPRPKDDVIPYAVAGHLGLPIYGTIDAPEDLVNTGGNFMSDGNGRGFSSKLVLTENGPNNHYGTSNHSEEEVDDIMRQFMGIQEYVKMTTLPYDGIHHIDMHMKLVNEETLIVGEYPDGVADGPQIEANLQYIIEQFKLASGRDYHVVRIPMPPDEFGRYPDANGYYRTYANAMIVNKTILLPVYEEQYDTTALRIWRETMPGYNVVGINCNSIIPASGALHCIIKEVGVDRPLWIYHTQPVDVMADEPITLEAKIKQITGINTAQVFYRTAGNTLFDSLTMVPGFNDIWTATLPSFAGDAVVEYYFKAAPNEGNAVTRPLPAPEGFFRLFVEPVATGITGLQSASTSLDVFPNPASAMTCVPINAAAGSFSGELALFDIYGHEVHQIYSGVFPAGASKYFFDAGKLTPGFYLLELKGTGLQLHTPVVIQ